MVDHYTLDIKAETDAYICERTLKRYHRLAIEKDVDRVLFRSWTDLLIKAVGADTGEQLLDTSAFRSARRSLTRLGIIVESIRKFLREHRRVHSTLHSQADRGLVRKYLGHQGDGCFASGPRPKNWST